MESLPQDIASAEAWLRQLGAADKNYEALAECIRYCRQQGVGAEQLSLALRVAQTLSSLEIDQDCLCAAVLYILVDSGDLNIAEIKEHFAPVVVVLVETSLRVKKLDVSWLRTPMRAEKEQANNLRSMVLVMAGDLRVTLIALAEKSVRLQLALAASDEQVRSQAIEVMRIYAPIAAQLGLNKLQHEMEDLCFWAIAPRQCERLQTQVRQQQLEWEKNGPVLIETIHGELLERGIDSRVEGRVKSLYNIWRKMRRKKVGITGMHDAVGVRIVVGDEVECYRTLAHIHKRWRHLSGELDDYIGNPKPNGYQSLHTAVLIPGVGTLEVQIRTEEMDRAAENGACSHWRYKGETLTNRWFDSKMGKLRQWAAEGEDPEWESANELFEELVRQHIYVFSRDGDVVELPAGATVLDFAYYLHTDLGHSCRSAAVDGQRVPVGFVLKNGQKVEVFAGGSGEPKYEWLDPAAAFPTTARARHRVQQWFRRLDADRAREKGEAMLLPELRHLGLAASSMREIAVKLKLETVDQMLIELGQNKRPLAQVVEIAAMIQSKAPPAETLRPQS